jgi:hypothetical protein
MTCRAFLAAAMPGQRRRPLMVQRQRRPAALKIKAGISGEDWGTTQKGDKVSFSP